LISCREVNRRKVFEIRVSVVSPSAKEIIAEQLVMITNTDKSVVSSLFVVFKSLSSLIFVFLL